MKKKLVLAFTVVAAIGSIIGYYNQMNKIALSPLTLANIEALTDNEDGELNPNIGNGMIREDCYDKRGKIIGSHCVSSPDPYDQCNYSMSWGDC